MAAGQEDVVAFRETCFSLGVSVAVERSRSGNDAHVWFFFTEPVTAAVARIMGCYLITETMSRRHKLSMESYDRLFPSQDTMRDIVKHIIVLQGGMGVKQRRKVMSYLAAIPDDEERLILATGRYIGEGFDDARLDTLFLALPFSWKEMLVQYAGRLHRLHPGKEEVRVYDYVDVAVPMLAKMHEKRMKGFRAMGYEQREL